MGSTGRTGPMGASGESPTATATASIEPITTAPTIPMSPSIMVMAGSAPRACSVRRSSSASRDLAADHLGGDEQCRQRGDDPEHTEGDGLGLDGAFGLGDRRGTDDRGGEVGRQDALQLGVDRAQVARPGGLDAR